jgi:hypothetical protein
MTGAAVLAATSRLGKAHHLARRLAETGRMLFDALDDTPTRYQLATGPRPYRGARNWTSFDQRMRTIGTLFRLRQRQADLFDAPFDDVETARLLGTELRPS